MTGTFLNKRRQAAVGQVDRWVRATVPDSVALGADELTKMGFGRYGTGWRLPLPDGGALVLLLDAAFPYSLPRMAVVGRDDVLSRAHVEDNGLLCLAPSGSGVDALDPVGVVESTVRDALLLLAEDTAGDADPDFRNDVEAYWRRDAVLAEPGIRSILSFRPPSRVVKAWHGENFYLVGETSEECLRWMENRHGPDKMRTIQDAAALWLDDLPTPNAYPTTVAQLRDLVRTSSVDGLGVLDGLLADEPYRLAVLLMGATPGGRLASVGVILEKPDVQGGQGRHARNPTTRGFRPGHAPATVLAQRYGLRRVEVDRADAARTRMDPNVVDALDGKTVAVVGCGALGAGVARLLIQSGVRRLLLVDPDLLGWENIGRHELGAEWVDQRKATALAEHLRKRFPDAIDIHPEDVGWQMALHRRPSLFNDCDLVVAATGDWNAESALNDLHRSGDIPCPVLYGWMEERASAAHALVVGAEGACLRCGFGRTGVPEAPATIWPDRVVSAECGGGTSVYGAVDLAHAQSLVATLAMDVLMGRVVAPVRRAWLAPAAVLDSGRGAWHPEWKSRYGDPGQGGIMIATPWPQMQGCPGCSALPT